MQRAPSPHRTGCSAALITGIVLLLGTAPASAAVRFNGPYTATKVGASYVHNYQEIPNITSYEACIYGMGGDYYDSIHHICTFDNYTYVAPYLVGPKRGDLLHFAPTADAGPAAQIQLAAFPEHPSVVHSAVCSSGYSTCTQIWENTAISDINQLIDSECDPASAYDFVSMPPGLRWANPMADTYGTIKYARPTSQSMIDAWSTNSYSHLGPNYGGSYWYKIGGYSRYKAYSMCSESASDAMGLNADEGDNKVDLSSSKVSYVLSVGHSKIYSLCRDNISGWARFCFGQGGRDGICDKLANEVLNAFMDEPWRGSGSPVARRVYGMTAPADQHCHIAGTCPGAAPPPPPPPPSGGY